jgi:hypothetical protein
LAADLKLAGTKDLIAIDSISNDLAILMNDGGGSYRPPTYVALDNEPKDAAVADINGDGLPDIVVSYDSGLTVLLNRGNGEFATPVKIIESELGPTVIADVGDGGQLSVLTRLISQPGVVLLENQVESVTRSQIPAPAALSAETQKQ